MSNHITIELCTEDRARIDRLIDALEKNAHDCTSCVKDAIQMTQAPKLGTPHERPTEATGAPTVEPAPTDHPADETLRETAAPATEAKPTITQEQLQQKVTQLAAANNGILKAAVREIVNTYAKKVSEVPEDKRAEVWDKLTALEEGQA